MSADVRFGPTVSIRGGSVSIRQTPPAILDGHAGFHSVSRPYKFPAQPAKLDLFGCRPGGIAVFRAVDQRGVVPSMPQPHLEIQTPDGVRTLSIGDKPITVGRHSTNVITLNDGMCSRYHCVIEMSPEGLRVRDLDSSNGTRVNGHVVKTWKLGDGDVVNIGRSSIAVHAPNIAPTPRPVAVPRMRKRILRLKSSNSTMKKPPRRPAGMRRCWCAWPSRWRTRNSPKTTSFCTTCAVLGASGQIRSAEQEGGCRAARGAGHLQADPAHLLSHSRLRCSHRAQAG